MMYWIPIAIVYYIIYAVISKHSNIGEENSLRYMVALFFLQTFGIWPFVARYSDNLIRDGLLFDFIIIMTFYGTMLLLGVGKNFGITQWVGAALAIIGVLMMKVNK